MKDQSLAYAVLSVGVGNRVKFGGASIRYAIGDSENMYLSEFVRDPRVAMAILELAQGPPYYFQFIMDRKVSSTLTNRVWVYDDIEDKSVAHARHESLPRAIIEACVKALR